MVTLIWRISFKLPGQIAQAEIIKYTEEAAKKQVMDLEMLGATVVVVEDSEEGGDDPEHINHSGQENKKLTW